MFMVFRYCGFGDLGQRSSELNSLVCFCFRVYGAGLRGLGSGA